MERDSLYNKTAVCHQPKKLPTVPSKCDAAQLKAQNQTIIKSVSYWKGQVGNDDAEGGGGQRETLYGGVYTVKERLKNIRVE